MWQLIHTAPKNGDPILVTKSGYAYALQRCHIVYWGGIISDTSRPGFSNVGWHNQFDDDDEDAPMGDCFTHWMPLPESPQVRNED